MRFVLSVPESLVSESIDDFFVGPCGARALMFVATFWAGLASFRSTVGSCLRSVDEAGWCPPLSLVEESPEAEVEDTGSTGLVSRGRMGDAVLLLQYLVRDVVCGLGHSLPAVNASTATFQK